MLGRPVSGMSAALTASSVGGSGNAPAGSAPASMRTSTTYGSASGPGWVPADETAGGKALVGQGGSGDDGHGKTLSTGHGSAPAGISVG